MRTPYILCSLFLVLFLIAGAAREAAAVRIKFLLSVYDDGREIGLRQPEGVACTDTFFIVADTGNNRLVKYTYQGKNVTPDTEFDVPVNSPLTVQINSKNELYVLDGKDRRILILNPDGSAKGYLTPKGSPVAGKMVPRSFKIDQSDNIYILDVFTGLVLVLDPAGNYIRHLPFPERYGFFSDLAVDRQGSIYLVDSVESEVYAQASGGDQFTPLTRNLKDYVNFPVNVTIDNQGILFLVDRHGSNLALVGRDGSFLGHQFGYGWHESQFYYPAQICISQGGTVFVADRNNNRIQIFSELE